MSASLVTSLKDGIVTKDIIRHDELSSLFIPGLYKPAHAIKLYCHNFIIAMNNSSLKELQKNCVSLHDQIARENSS